MKLFMQSNTFCHDGCDQKANIVELKYRPGGDDGLLAYIMPPKFLALEKGGGKMFLEETSFSRTGSDSLPPPPSPFLVNPAIQAIQDKVDSIEPQRIQSNHLMHQANRNVKLFGIFSMVL